MPAEFAFLCLLSWLGWHCNGTVGRQLPCSVFQSELMLRPQPNQLTLCWLWFNQRWSWIKWGANKVSTSIQPSSKQEPQHHFPWHFNFSSTIIKLKIPYATHKLLNFSHTYHSFPNPPSLLLYPGIRINNVMTLKYIQLWACTRIRYWANNNILQPWVQVLGSIWALDWVLVRLVYQTRFESEKETTRYSTGFIYL